VAIIDAMLRQSWERIFDGKKLLWGGQWRWRSSREVEKTLKKN
jgi:hypothetical protein